MEVEPDMVEVLFHFFHTGVTLHFLLIEHCQISWKYALVALPY